MGYMLDTNICIFAIKKKHPKLLHNLRDHSVLEICISSITLSELYYGACKSEYREKNLTALEKMLTTIEVSPFDERAASAYGEIRANLERKGQIIGPLDTLIAAHAMSLNAILITNNTKEFLRVKGLAVEDWC